MENLTDKFNELAELKAQIESDVFQKYIVKPMRKEQDSLRLNFFSDSLKDSWRKGGKHEGIKVFFEILKEIDIEIKNTKYKLENPS